MNAAQECGCDYCVTKRQRQRAGNAQATPVEQPLTPEIKVAGVEVNGVFYPVVRAGSFGHALELLKNGERVQRTGWNGRGMWLAMSGNADAPTEVQAEKFWAPANRNFAYQNGGSAAVEACITMKTTRNTIQMGWAPTQSDMLATDWVALT